MKEAYLQLILSKVRMRADKEFDKIHETLMSEYKDLDPRFMELFKANFITGAEIGAAIGIAEGLEIFLNKK